MKRGLGKEFDNAIDTSGTSLEWNPDPKGYFTIKPFFSQKKVFVRHYNSKDVLEQTFCRNKYTRNSSSYHPKETNLEIRPCSLSWKRNRKSDNCIKKQKEKNCIKKENK